MKNILLLIGLASLIYAGEKDLVLKKNIGVEKYLEATSMETSFSIEALNKDYNIILKGFEATHLKIKELLNSNINIKCTGGQNYIDPMFKYVENKKSFDGYFGKSMYQCKFKSVDDYNKLLNIAINDKQLININPIKWYVDKDLIIETEKELEAQLMKNFIDVVGLYSKQLLSTCVATNMEILNNNNNEIMFERNTMLSASKMQVSEPLKENKRVFVSANIEFRCEAKK